MTVTVLGGPIVRTRHGVGDWVVWAVEHPGGVARVEHRNGLTEVVVADAPRSADEVDPGFTAVACTVDGAALVVCHASPRHCSSGLGIAAPRPPSREGAS